RSQVGAGFIGIEGAGGGNHEPVSADSIQTHAIHEIAFYQVFFG
ncbi:MAG: hypothetical protein ACI8W7_004614, partial [Gammaproteobacteria bacterium]